MSKLSASPSVEGGLHNRIDDEYVLRNLSSAVIVRGSAGSAQPPSILLRSNFKTTGCVYANLLSSTGSSVGASASSYFG